jgi:hypothetical protein
MTNVKDQATITRLMQEVNVLTAALRDVTSVDGHMGWTPKINSYYEQGVLVKQTIQYNPKGEEIPFPNDPKPWVGLDEMEITQAMVEADAIIVGPKQFRFAEVIGAKLKEKNHG